MANGLTKSDLEDIDFVDSFELNSCGSQSVTGLYLQSTLINTTSTTN